VSGIGDFMYAVAFVVWILRETDSVTWVSLSVILRLAPPALLGSFGGVLADRVDRRRLMMTVDLGMAACMGGVALLTLVGGRGAVVVAIALTVVNALLATPRRPAEAALTPRLVGEDDLAAANALTGAVAQIMWFAGPAIGAGILAITHEPGWAFALNALTFVVSATLVAGVRLPDGDASAATIDRSEPDGESPADGAFAMWRDGLRAIRHTPGGVAVMGLIAAVLLAYGFEIVLHVFVATERLGLGEAGLGTMTMVVGLGGLAGAPFTSRVASSRRPGTLLVVSGIALGISLGGLAFTTHRTVAYALLFLEGLGNVIFEVLSITMVQRLFGNDVLGRVFGVSDSLSTTAMLAGSIAAPVIVAGPGLETALVVGGGVLAAWALLAWPRLSMAGRGTVDAMDALAPLVTRLGALGIFAGASTAVLERVARATTTVSVPAGTVVIRQGDPADDLYVIERGTCSVHDLQTLINAMGPGHWFGEIGLVERRPRTASVTADVDTELLRIDGAEFLAALGDLAATPEPLTRGVRTRLARTAAIERARGRG
jgi:MFS family permease